MGKKVNLPLFEKSEQADEKKPSVKKPSIDAARARLGGRVTSEDAPPGWLVPGVTVTFSIGSAARMPGVVVFASSEEVHVLLDGIRLRRFPPGDLERHDAGTDGPLNGELQKLAADARLFGLLVEREPVRYADDSGSLVDGKVVEKCRWGALVLRDDGTVVAVGFRKLWPIPAASATAS